MQAARSLGLLAAPALAQFGGSDVSVWLLSLAKCRPYLRECFSLLSPEERNRVHSLHSETRRNAYIAAHAMLRLKLSILSGEEIAPQAWSFQVGPYGKPHLVGSSSGFSVSLSYSKEIAAIAVSRVYEIGIDVEAVPAMLPSPGIPWRVLSAAECAFLQAVPEKRQFAEFLKIWTLKEACSKCFGLDASRDFRSIRVRVNPLGVEMEPPRALIGATPFLHQDTVETDHLGFILALVAATPGGMRTSREGNNAARYHPNGSSRIIIG
jgi:4'-phosphopantetheinyl transferase